MIPRVCVLSLLLLSVRSYEVNSYSQVATAGSGHQDGPKVYKALNMDLIFPKTFNSSENVISTTQTSAPQPVMTEAVESLSSTADEQFTPERSSSQTSAALPPSPSPSESEVAVAANHYPISFVTPNNRADESEESEATSPPSATGRAVDYRPAYPFSQLLTPNSKGHNRPSSESYPLRSRPVSRPSTTGQRVVYPSYQAPRIPSRAEIDKLSGKGQFSDRFSPSEAVASSGFKQTQTRNRKPSISRPIGQPSNRVSSFVPTKDLYTFPPNVNSRYPSPSDIKQASPSDTVTSYLPPATGPLDTSKFVGPVNPDLLPAAPAGGGKDMSGGGYHYDPPQTPLDVNLGAQKDNDQGPPPPMDDGGMMDTGPPPPPTADDGDMIDDSPPPPDHDHDHHDYPHDIGGYADDKEYPTPPPGYLEDHGDHDFHHHHHHPDYDFSHGPYFHGHHHDHYPDVIYDDYHDHHFHHDHIVEHLPEPEPTTTMAPPPPPPPPAPEQPRVKKYSYFYIGRKLWYIPLYFTLWFTFYVLWLILKSIARHKVNLPNHYVNRRSIEDLNHREAREAIDKLTAKVMDGIETFKLKFVG